MHGEDLAEVPVVAGEDCDYAELEGAAEKMRKRLRTSSLAISRRTPS